MAKAKSVTVELEMTRGVDVEWHIDDSGALVVDHSNVPVTDDLIEAICPTWVQEAMRASQK